MTDFSAWDKLASVLVDEAERDDEELRRRSDMALGLQEVPRGPPTAAAQQQRAEMNQHSNGRRNFIAEQQAKEVVLTYANTTVAVVVSAEQVAGRAVRLQNCTDVTLEFPSGVALVKLLVERCQRIKIRIGCPIRTSFLEISHCSDVDMLLEQPIATVQCDECDAGPIRFRFLEPECVGAFFHQNAPALEILIDGSLPGQIGNFGNAQVCTRVDASGAFMTEAIVRAENDFPVNIGLCDTRQVLELMPESLQPIDDCRTKALAKREDGNDAFRASDFLQAAVIFTEAIEMCDDIHQIWANRAQCFLKTGQPDKALVDAIRCTELAPHYAKGWFRKGMALHAMQQYAEAIAALCEAEKSDPRNPQISEAIKMAQLMARRNVLGQV